MNIDERVLDLLAEWQAAAERGERIDLAAFCGKHPELSDEVRRRIEMLEQMRWLHDGRADEIERGSTAGDADTVSLDSQTGFRSPRTAPILQQLGDYELLEEIARGGMGVVYKARQQRLKRIVAVKMILSGDFASAADVERFHTEAEAAAQLDNPHIVPIYEVGEHAGLHYFSMGFVEGESLAARINTSPLAPREAAELLKKVCHAVQYAHGQGVIHRDLKPGNILLDQNTEPRITDFGLAKRTTAGGKDLTGTGQILGTPSYMPPEQALGQTSQVREAADIYALGAVLYAMLCGRPPFQADNPLETVKQVVERDPVPPRQLNPSVPIDLETIALKCLEKSPAKRYPTAAAIAGELQRFLTGQPIQARPITFVERAWRVARRNPVTSSLLTLILLLVVGTAIGSTTAALYLQDLSSREQIARKTAEFREGEERKARQKAQDAETAERVARQLAQDAEIAERKAKEESESRRTILRKELSKQYVKAGAEKVDVDDYFGGLYWYIKALELDEGDPTREPIHRLRIGMLLKETPRITGMYTHDGPLAGAEFSHDGTKVVTAGYDHVAKIWDVATGKQLGPDLKHGHVVYQARFSPDDQLVATCGYDRTARVWDVATGELAYGPFVHGEQVSDVVFSPDSTKIVTSTNNPRFFRPPPPGQVFPLDTENPVDLKKPMGSVWELATGERVPLQPKGVVHGAFFTPDGQKVVVLSPAVKAVNVFDATTGELVAGPMTTLTEPESASISRNGKYLIVREFRRSAPAFFDPITGEMLFSLDTLSPGVAGKPPVFSPYLGIAQVAIEQLWKEEPEKLFPVRKFADLYIVPQSSPVARKGNRRLSPQLSDQNWSSPAIRVGSRPNQILICAEHNAAVLWDLAPQAPRISPLNCGLGPRSLQYNRDGKQLLVSDLAGRVTIFDSATGKARLTFGHGPDNRYAAWCLDDQQIVTADDRGELSFWDAATGKRLGDPLRLPNKILRFAVSPDQQTAAVNHLRAFSTQPYPDYSVFNLQTREQRCPTFHHGYNTSGMAFSSQGHLLATLGVNNTVRVHDLSTGKLLSDAHRHGFNTADAVFVDNDATLISVGGDLTVRAIDIASKKERWQYRLSTSAGGLEADHSRQRLAVVDGARVRILSVADGKPLTPFFLVSLIKGGSLRFSPQGEWLAVGSGGEAPGWATLIDTATGERIGPPLRHVRYVNNVAIRADGQQLATAAGDGFVRLWDLTADQRPLADLKQLLWLLYPYDTDETGSVAPLPPEKIRAAFQFVAEKYPHEVSVTAEQIRAWERNLLLQTSNESPEYCWQMLEQAKGEERTDLNWLRTRPGIASNAKNKTWQDQALLEFAEAGYCDVGLFESIENRATFSDGFPASLAILNRLIEKQPDNAPLRLLRGHVQFAGGELRAAIADATRGFELYPTEHFMLLRGQSHLELGEFDQAIPDLERARLACVREDFCSSALLGMYLKQDNAQAVTELKKQLWYRRGDEFRKPLYWPLCFVMFPEPPPPAALEHVDALIKAGNTGYIFHVTRGGLLMRAGRLDEAEKVLLEQVSRNSRNPYAHAFLAHVYLAKKDYERAKKHCDAASTTLQQFSLALDEAAALPDGSLFRLLRTALGRLGLDRDDHLHLDYLVREAERELPKAPPSPPKE